MPISYNTAIDKVASLSPTLDNPTRFIQWAEAVAEVLSTVYELDYDTVTVELIEACKELQDYED